MRRRRAARVRAPSVSRLTPEQAASALERAVAIPTGRGARRVPSTLEGLDPRGAAITVELRRPMIVLALSTTCDGCAELARSVADGVDGFDVVGLLRAPTGSVSQADVMAYTERGGRWLVGDATFELLDIDAAPFFCVIATTGAVLVEGVTFGRRHLDEHLAHVRAGSAQPDSVQLHPGRP